MRSNLLLTLSSLAYGAAGATLLFAPAETLALIDPAATRLTAVMMSAYGAALFGFAMLNWMSRYSTIGGIYGRPLVVANFAHAFAAGMGFGRVAASSRSGVVIAAAVIYAAIALGFGAVLLGRSPVQKS